MIKHLILPILFAPLSGLYAAPPLPVIDPWHSDPNENAELKENQFTFNFKILKSGLIEHEGVEFTLKQFTAIAKSVFRARPSSRIVIIGEEGVSITEDHPAMKTGREIGFTDVIALVIFF